jgi:hypothetical protein
MDYKIHLDYCWYYETKIPRIVLMYFICGIPFATNEVLPEIENNPEIIKRANKNKKWNLEELYDKSFYLIEEECHPLLFSLDLENPELLETIDTEL